MVPPIDESAPRRRIDEQRELCNSLNPPRIALAALAYRRLASHLVPD
jgi:hypothetical protein